VSFRRAVGRPSPVDGPAAADLLAAREKYDLDPDEAAALIYYSGRAWREWEAGRTPMHRCAWELFNIKAKARSKRLGRASPSQPQSAAGLQ